MNKKILFGFVLIVGVAAAGLSFSKQILGARDPHLLQEKSVALDADVLESVFYEHFFKSIVATQDTTNLKAKTGLDDEEMSVLQALAQQCGTEIAKVDEKARPILEDFRAKLEKVKRKEDLPPPPAVLTELQRERNAVALRYRDMLRTTVGDLKFIRAREFARSVVKIEVIESPEKPKN